MTPLRAEVVSLRQETGPLLAELVRDPQPRPRRRWPRPATISSGSIVCLGSAEAISGAVAGSGRVACAR